MILVVFGQACPKYPKFAISLQYLKKEVSDEVFFFFLHANKHESLLQIDTMILMGWSSISEVPKIASSQ